MSVVLIGGRYELLNRLGAGGMGEVYRSRDRLTEEIVSLKRALQMPAALAAVTPFRGGPEDPTVSDVTTIAESSSFSPDSSEKTRMARLALASEFRVLSSLRHPHIVSVLDYGFQTNGLPFFTMKLLPDAMHLNHAAHGKSLDAQLDLLFQMLQALSYLHRHGVVHRDLKPSNVLVTGRHVTVLDFGVAGLPEHTVAGTAGYMAPEVQLGERPTPAADFYAVGAIAYEILTGEPLYRLLREDSVPGDNLDLSRLDGFGAMGELVKTLLSADPIQRR